MSDLAEALFWKYGPVVSCDLGTETIIDWKHPTLPKPNAAEIAQAITEYRAALPAIEALKDEPTEREQALIDLLNTRIPSLVQNPIDRAAFAAAVRGRRP